VCISSLDTQDSSLSLGTGRTLSTPATLNVTPHSPDLSVTHAPTAACTRLRSTADVYTGQQFVLDAYTHTHKSRSHARFCDLLTDLATGRIYPIFTNDRSAAELCQHTSVMEIYASGTYGKVRTCKDVIFDEYIDFLNPDPSSMPSEADFNVDAVAISTAPDAERRVAFVPPSISTAATRPYLLHLYYLLCPHLRFRGARTLSYPLPSKAHGWHRQLSLPARLSLVVPRLRGVESPQSLKSLASTAPVFLIMHTLVLNLLFVATSMTYALTNFQEEDMVQHWYNYLAPNYEFSLSSVETEHCLLTVTAKASDVPRTFWQAIEDPVSADAINKERKKFEANCCLAIVPDTGQHQDRWHNPS
jgi:hypothetical protein